MDAHSSFEIKVLAAFGAAALVVLGLAGTTWYMARDSAVAEQSVALTHAVLDNLAHTRADTLQIEFSTQSYRISGDPARLTERDSAIASREAALSQIRQLTRDNARQQARLTQLRAVIEERLAISRQVALLRQTQGIEAANSYVAKAPLQETRERINRILQEMDVEERQLLAQRSAAQARAHQAMVNAGAVVTALLIALLGATYGLIRRQLRETRASQRQLADSEQSLAATLHSIGDAVLATDTQGRITRMNPVAQALTGWPLAQALGRPVDEVFRILHEETREVAETPVARVLASGQIQELTNHTRLLARDGREHPITDSAAPIRDASGRVSGVVLVFRDVTLAQQARQAISEQNERLEQRVHERTAQLEESQDHLRSVTSNVPALIAYVDAQQRYVYVNDQYRQRFAPELADLTGRSVREILGETRYAIAEPLIAQVLQGQPQSYDWQPFPSIWQVINYVPKRDAQQQVVGYYVLGTDITERKHTEERIQALNSELERHVRELEHVSQALRTLSAGNRAMLRAADEQDLLDSMCHAIVETGHYAMASVWYCIDDEFKSLQVMAESGHPGGLSALRMMKGSWGDNEFGRGAVATAIRSGQTSVVRNILTAPGYTPWRTYLSDYACVVACPLRVQGRVIGGLAIYAGDPDSFKSDEMMFLTESADDMAFGITTLRARAQQQQAQDAMQRLAHYDALTGLPNEAQFAAFLSTALDSATTQAQPQPFALLQTNIERLSDINDALGFLHGDQMLIEFSNRLRAVAPEQAQVARLRGDEFAVLLPNSQVRDAEILIQRLEGALARPFSIADIPLDLAARFGVALFPDHGSTVHDLFRHMDTAVHQAKIKGLGHFIFDPAQNPDQSHRLQLAGELRHAIERGEMRLYLQPKVEMASGRVCGAEGLVRWQHPQRGLVPPVEFIGLAEQTGLIKPITEWVIETALRLNHDWARQHCALPIAVNLSARDLRDEGLLHKVRQLQATWGGGAGLLEMEITESMVMDDADQALRMLRGLRAQGIPLYIDDFGTGYSSLSYLQQLPVEYIKIDQSFVRNLTRSKDSALIVRSTIDLAHDLGRKVVAEGVETQAHWDQLAAYGCDIAQGYFIARPMPAPTFQSWLSEYRVPAGCSG